MPDRLDLVTAATVPLNALAAAQLVDLLGDGGGRSLLVTGAAGAVGGYVVPLARDRGWQVTGLARAKDEKFVRGLGTDFTTEATLGWDAVADGAALQAEGVALVRDGGLFVGVQPGARPPAERGVNVRVVVAQPDGARLAQLLEATANGHLPARVHAVVPLDRVAAAHREVAKVGVRGRYVLQPCSPRGESSIRTRNRTSTDLSFRPRRVGCGSVVRSRRSVRTSGHGTANRARN